MLQSHAARRRHARWRVDFAIHEAIEIARHQRIETPFLNLLDIVRARSGLLSLERRGCRTLDVPAVLRALLAFSGTTADWLRQPRAWSGASGSIGDQFDSLVQHVYLKEPIPAFLNRVWAEPSPSLALRHRKVFKHVAGGFGIRGADIPLQLTRGMAKFVDEVPAHCSVEQGVRWCQIRGLGGSVEMAAAMVDTDLGVFFLDQPFWERVIVELVRRPDITPRFAKAALRLSFRDRSVFPCRGRERMSNRDFETLRRRVTAFESENRENEVKRWKPSGIPAFAFEESPSDPWTGRRWSIREITDGDSLAEEGRRMRHCVATYADRCRQGRTTIWSMRNEGVLNVERALTIEVLPRTRRVITALGPRNRRPHPSERRVLEAWARRADLTIGSYV